MPDDYATLPIAVQFQYGDDDLVAMSITYVNEAEIEEDSRETTILEFTNEMSEQIGLAIGEFQFNTSRLAELVQQTRRLARIPKTRPSRKTQEEEDG